MVQIKLRHRHRLRRKEIKRLCDDIESVLGCSSFSTDDNVESAKFGDLDLILLEGRALAMFIEGKTFLTIRGILKFSPTKSWVTVDMGAVGFLVNGADVMSPGILEMEDGVEEGRGVWVRDVQNRKPLAVGILQIPKTEILSTRKGKAIKTVHYVGDKIWNIGEE